MKKNNIPKIIHYCWFGKGKLPELETKCLNSWKEILKDYEIMEWNEENFDINCNQYVKEAYENKKYAFVSDYARLYALYNYGGIYLDTDVEVLKSLNEFLNNNAFCGFENNNSLSTALIGATKNNAWIKSLLEDYEDIPFIKSDGKMDLTTNVERITKTTQSLYNIELKEGYIETKEIVIYPHEYFSPKDWESGDINLTENSYTIHHFKASWHSKKEKKQIAKKKRYINKYGKDLGNKKYQKYLKKQKILNYFTYPLKAIKNPKKILAKLKGKK